MVTIIAGSRSLTDYQLVEEAMERCGWVPTVVVSGRAPRGIDRLGERWAQQRKIELIRMPADWEKFGLRAGPLRNIEMAKIAMALVAVHDGKSSGTAHMIAAARERNLRVYVHLVPAALRSRFAPLPDFTLGEIE